MKTTVFVLTLSVATLLSSCHFNLDIGEDGNGNVVTEERQVNGDFNEVKGSAGLDVILTQGDENKIVVEADENLLQYIETDVENGMLHITTSENIGHSKAKKVYVTFKQLDKVEASSGADVTGKSVIKSENLSLKSSSGADLNVEVFTKDLTAKSSSGASLTIAGKASSLNADASSGSELDAKDLLTINCSAEASSGSGITVNVKETLETHASSGGDINYYGNPVSVNSDNNRSGSVHKM